MSRSARRVASACFAGALAACGNSFPGIPIAEKFDRTRWIAARENRGGMADDLIANQLKVGMTKAELGTLLGFDPARVGSRYSEDIGAVASTGFTPCCHFRLEFDEEDRLTGVFLDPY